MTGPEAPYVGFVGFSADALRNPPYVGFVGSKPTEPGNAFDIVYKGIKCMEIKPTIFDVQEVLKYLPHRYPFLLVDRIVEFEANQRIVGLKNVTINEPFFPGHFPGVPIMPGVLILESMAQVGGFLVFKAAEDRDKKLVFFAGVENARFRRPVRPGDQLKIEMTVLKIKSRIGKLHGCAFVDGQIAAEADIMFSMVSRGDFAEAANE